MDHLHGCRILRHVAGAPHPILVSPLEVENWVSDSTDLGVWRRWFHQMVHSCWIPPTGNPTWLDGTFPYMAMVAMDGFFMGTHRSKYGGFSIAMFDY